MTTGAGETAAVERIRQLPGSERLEALEELVTAEVRAALLIPADEDVPMDVSFFDLGFTSVRLTDTRRRLENVLGRTINTSALFDRPTVRQLVTHLADEVLPELTRY